MNKKEVESLAVKSGVKKESVVVAFRVPKQVDAAIKARGLDPAKSARNYLLMLADK
jgi:hypothetical protein